MRLLHTLLLSAVAISLTAAHPAKSRTAPRTTKPAAHTQAGPRKIGIFDDWTAATHAEGGKPVCYAFTRAQSSAPALPGRGDVVLTVTDRPTSRDEVALSAGFAYAPNAEPTLTVNHKDLPFYTGARSAFAKDGHATIAAFSGARTAAIASPGPKNKTVTDTFSLRGFPAAYAAINKACPAK